MAVVNYKCPACGAGLTFDSKTQKMTCEYCGNSYEVQDLEAMYAAETNQVEEDTREHWEGFDPEQWQTRDMQGMKVWNCPSCGAEVIAEETSGAMKCPYCDNPMIMPEQFSGMYLPDYIIPFKKTKQEAVQALKNHYLHKPLLPKVFKDENHMEEIRAVYVPFWMFDLEASGNFRYEAVRTTYFEDRRFEYTKEDFFQVIRSGTMDFQKIPVDGSQKIDDTMMEAIEPYHYGELEPFQISYLSGYLANKYDVEPDALTGRVHERMKSSVSASFRDSVIGYDLVTPQREDIRISKKGQVKYALLPVWFLNTKWNGKQYTFAMNGQTGKLIGDLPIGRDLLVQYWLRKHIPLTLLMTMVMIVLRLAGVI
jgi:DNA-directed RNA polymerase subunit RPC12/RpoP